MIGVVIARLYSLVVALNFCKYQFEPVAELYRSRPSAAVNRSASIVKMNKHKQCFSALNNWNNVWDDRRNIRRSTSTTSHELIEFFDLYEPEANCFSEERFGGGMSGIRYGAFGDGPKFICGVDLLATKEGDCLVYSVGSNNRIDFEVSVKQFLGCETHTFDPTIDSFVGGDYAIWHQWGLGKEGEKITFNQHTFRTMSLESIYKRLGHQKTGRKIDILKIDCEMCEWAVMPLVFQAIASGKIQIDQILIEVHMGEANHQSLRSFFEAADAAHMRVFHKERNHWGCQGFACVEYAFVSESFLSEANAWFACSSKDD